jgi:hypothetical protein
MAVVALVEHVDEELVTEGDEATQEPQQEASTGALRTTEEQREETKAAVLELLSTQRKRHPSLIKWLRDNHRMALPDGDALVAELIKAGLIERDENARYGTVAKRETTEAPLMLAERTGDDAPLAKVHEPEAKERSKEAPRPKSGTGVCPGLQAPAMRHAAAALESREAGLHQGSQRAAQGREGWFR